ncbi:MAG: hypothetical protein WBB45_11340 [Cyclobacteriaceae bacterium]
MKKKVTLENLSVKSFTTDISGVEKGIKGGATYVSDYSYCRDSGCKHCLIAEY